jgi:hypothetical protein
MVTRERTLRVCHGKGKQASPPCPHQSQRVLTSVERFGWVNASYVVGLSMINIHMKRALGTLTPYETFAKATRMRIDEEHDSDLENGVDELSVEGALLEE